MWPHKITLANIIWGVIAVFGALFIIVVFGSMLIAAAEGGIGCFLGMFVLLAIPIGLSIMCRYAQYHDRMLDIEEEEECRTCIHWRRCK